MAKFDPKIVDEFAPRPWGFDWNADSGFVYLVDANGKKLGTIYRSTVNKALLASLIIDAVNNYDEPTP